MGAGLLGLDRLHETWSVPRFTTAAQPTPVTPLATHLGEDLLAFITEPKELAQPDHR